MDDDLKLPFKKPSATKLKRQEMKRDLCRGTCYDRRRGVAVAYTVADISIMMGTNDGSGLLSTTTGR